MILPRELVLASAGSGKTYHISSRIIRLLAGGTPAHAVLASTFTRKAAGEILERVLVRLAEGASDPEKARELVQRIRRGMREIDSILLGGGDVKSAATKAEASARRIEELLKKSISPSLSISPLHAATVSHFSSPITPDFLETLEKVLSLLFLYSIL